MNEFTGFDVCGILISRGSVGGFADAHLLMPGPDELRLLNPDGYTRWWNPMEFPVNNGTIFGYTDGLLGTKHESAHFDATLNGYKYYCDDLHNPDDPMNQVDPTGRGIFSAGSKNVRHYTIQMGDYGLIFNYAVDASWQFPVGPYPWGVPDDFAEEANRPEAWNISVTAAENTLWNDGVDSGGGLALIVDVYDWFNAGLNLVTVESPGNFDAVEDVISSGGGTGYSTYQVDIESAKPAPDAIDLLITVECEVSGYGGLLPGTAQAAYFMVSIPVDDEAPPVEEWPEEWACFQYNASNIGRNPNAQNFDPTDFTELWYTPISDWFKVPGPAVTENYIYVTANNTYYSNSSHYIYCLEINNGGSIKWQHQINPGADYGRSMTSPVWFDDGADGRVIVGGDRVWCLDAETGAVEWEYGIAYPWVRSNFKVYEGRVYGAADFMMHCIDAATGAQVWLGDPGYAADEVVPAVVDGRVYFGSADTFTCLDADDGSQIWHTTGVEGQGYWNGPLVVNNRIYLASHYQTLSCIDADNGDLLWEYTESTTAGWASGCTYWKDPADEKIVVYFGAGFTNGGCYGVKDQGDHPELFWKSFDFYSDASPVYDDGVIYCGDTYNDQLYGFDAATGAQIFQQPVTGGVRAAVGFAFGRMAVVTEAGVYCFESP